MQKRIITLSLTALVAVLIFSSCSKKTNKQGRYIPETAAAVMHINGESLNAKLPWDDIRQNEWFKEMQKDSSITAFQKTILDKPENSGINVKADIIIFYVSDSSAGYTAIEGAVTDETKFKSMLLETNKNGKETVKDGYTYFADEKNCVAYNKERFFATMQTNDYNYMTNPLPLPSDTGYGEPDGRNTPAKKTDMSAIAAQLIVLAEGKSLAKNEKFSELLATKGDAHFWLNAQYLNTAKSLGGMAAMANLGKLYDGNITAGTLNFENGKIDMDIKSFAGKELTDLYKKYSGSSVDKTMLQNIPSQNVAGVFALNFKPEGIKELLKILNMDGLANLGAGQIGFNLDDFIKANKGDILIAATDVKQDSSGFGTDAKFIFAASIGDKAAFGKLIDAGKKVGGPMLGSSSGTEKFSFNTNEKYFVFTNDKTNTDQFLAGSTAAAPSYIDKIVGGPFGGFVNFQYLLTSMKPRATADSIDKATYDATIKMWDNMILNGGNFKDGGLTQHWEINLLDKNTNSLKQLNAYLGKVGMLQKKKTDMQNTAWKDEDVMFDTPTTTTVETVPTPTDSKK
jgi:hypothetical protein